MVTQNERTHKMGMRWGDDPFSPIRTNTPRAGDVGYEPCAPLPRLRDLAMHRLPVDIRHAASQRRARLSFERLMDTLRRVYGGE
jgi:hypothetical protein